MAERKTVRIGFIGAGGICRSRHLPGLAKIDEAQVVAVANRTKESSQKVADEFGIPDVMDDWQALVARDDLDAVFIGTWPYTHLEMSKAVLESGKHVFCQARMCRNMDEARQMLAVAKAHPKQVNMICPPPTRMPFEAFIQKLIAEGQLGTLTAVTLKSVVGGNLSSDTLSWREDYALSGNQILSMGIMAETLHAFVGQYESLSAHTGTYIKTKKNSEGQEVEVKIPQNVVINGRLKNGALISEYFTGVAADKTTAGHELIIHGLEGTLRYTFGNQIEIAKAGEELKPFDVPADLQRDWHVEEDFINAIHAARAGESWSVSPDFEEGILYMQKVDAVHASMKSGQAIDPATM